MNLFVTQTRVVAVPVKTLSVAATCQQAMLIDAAGQCVGSTSAMPAFMPTLLEIDLATGAIKNWNVPTVAQLQAIADGQSAAVAATPLTEQRMAELMRKAHDEQIKDGVKQRHEGVLAQLRASEPLVVSPIPEKAGALVSAINDQMPRIKEIVASSVSKLLEIDPIKPVEIDTFNPSEVVPDTVAVLEKYATDMPILADEQTEADTTLCPTSSNWSPEGLVYFGVDFAAVEPVAPIEQAQPSTVREQFAEFLAERGIEPSAPKPTNQVSVHYDQLAEKWHAETNEHQATSTQGKFEAIKNVLKKANLHGVYEINRIEDELYSYDGSRTLNADTVYMTQGADGAWSARMPNNRPVSAVVGIDGALTGLLKEMEGIQPEDAVIIETTDDEMRSRNKRRYAVTAKHEHAPVEPSTANPVDLPSVAPTAATVEPVADPDDVVPVCTLKQKLEPLPAITDNGDLPSDFDGGDSDSAAVIEVTIYKRDSGEYAATTGAGATYVRASSKYSASDALKNLLKKCSLTVADSAIVETTTNDDFAQNRTRYSIDTSFAEPSDPDMASGDIELPESVAANPDQIDIEQAIAEALVRPELVMDLSQPAPVDIVTELDLRPFQVLNQLIAVQQRNCDPIYSAFFAARGITENGKLSSKGTRLLAGLSQAESNERGEQIIKNACEVSATDATYAEIVALINHSSTQMQALKLTDRISKHSNFAERQKLFFIQKDRIEALKAESAA